MIMTFGGRDSQNERLAIGVYESLIKRAAELEGYKVKRSDFDPTTGNILQDIMRDLSRADLVIADVTHFSPNTLWELGVRHALRRNGTIMICLEGTSMPFNISGYQTITYAHDLGRLQGDIDRLREQIRKRADPAGSDSPVFDFINPAEMNAGVNDARYASLLEEHTTLMERFAELEKRQTGDESNETSAPSQPTASLKARLERSERLYRLQPDQLFVDLRSPELEDREKFKNAVEAVLSSPELHDPESFFAALHVCAYRREYEIALVVAEDWYKRKPESKRALRHYANAMLLSQRLATEAQEMIARIEAALGIRRTTERNTFRIPRIATSDEISLLRTLTDYFEIREQSDRTLDLFNSLPEEVAQNPGILLNKARALASIGDKQQAFELFEKICNQDALREYAQARSWYADVLSNSGQNDKAYEYMEEAIYCDPTDHMLFLRLAEHILNTGYMRSSITGPLHRGGMETREAQGVPFFEYVIQHWPKRSDVLHKLAVSLDLRGYSRLWKRLSEGRERPLSELIRDSPSLARVLKRIDIVTTGSEPPEEEVLPTKPTGRRRSS